jgi:hypothetical protein
VAFVLGFFLLFNFSFYEKKDTQKNNSLIINAL